MTAASMPALPYASLSRTCRVIIGELLVADSLIYLTPSPADWLPMLQERLPQYSMQPHALGVLITRKESNDAAY